MACGGEPRQFFQTAISRQSGGVTHQSSQTPRDRDADFQPDSAPARVPGRTRRIDSCQFDRMSGANFQMRIAVKFDEFNGCAQQPGGFFRFSDALFGRAVRSGFAARANDKMRFASGASFRAQSRRRSQIQCRQDARRRPAMARGQGSSV